MKKGFTLIELAIALVIIGLITVGIMQGAKMIRSSELRKLITFSEELNRLSNLFQAKYSCLPGDCSRASMLLNSIMNGNGDGEITAFDDDGETIMENLSVFEHLSRAKLLSPVTVPEKECYASPDAGDMIGLFETCSFPIPVESVNSTVFLFAYMNFMGITQDSNPFACINTNVGCIIPDLNGSLTGEDIAEIDAAIDDGWPLKGRLISACTEETDSFADFATANKDLPYDKTRDTCGIILKF